MSHKKDDGLIWVNMTCICFLKFRSDSKTYRVFSVKQMKCNFDHCYVRFSTINELVIRKTCIIHLHRHKSRVMRKPFFCICENKDAEQLRGNREADQRLCFRYTDSTIPLLPKYEISDQVGNQNVGFLMIFHMYT